MSKLIIFCTFIFCFAIDASLAFAESAGSGGQHRGQMGDRMFKGMDSNNDGEVTRAEFDAAHAKRFKEMDANNDGKITREEMSAAGRKSVENEKNRRFDEADANHDGALSREEAGRWPMLSKNFEKVDANNDGKVTREEMDAEAKKMRRNSEKGK